MNFIDEAKRPFNFITLILAILGIVLSIIFYFKSEKKSEISFQFDETSSLLYNSKNLTKSIIIFDKDSLPIKKNVYLINGTIINSGNYEISKKNVRMPILIGLDKNSRIIDYKVTKQKDKSLANFSLVDKSKNELMLDWKYFDPNYGFKFQIIYESLKPSKLEIKGKILDINNFTEVKKNLFNDGFLNFHFNNLLIILFLFFLIIDLKVINKLFVKIILSVMVVSILIINIFRLFELIFPNTIDLN